MKFFEFDLVRTCYAYPEQYDVFLENKQVGYLRLRHGVFRAEYGDCGGETVYVAHPKGDGIFDDDERYKHLKNACDAIRETVVQKEFGDTKVWED